MAHLLAIDPVQSAELTRGISRGEPVAKPGAMRANLGLGTTVTDIDYLADALMSLVIDGPQWSYWSTPDGSDCWPEPDPRPRWSGSLTSTLNVHSNFACLWSEGEHR